MRRRSVAFFSTLKEAVSERGVALMGICNVTPDSFSDGGRFFSSENARARVDELLREGADIVDVGGESTRPRALPVAPVEQLARVLEIVRYAASKGACVSIDTQSPEVVHACLEAGAACVNDVSCLRDDALARVVSESGAAYVLMHSRGTQGEMTGFSEVRETDYDDVVVDVVREWTSAANRARELGVDDGSLLMDPGLGFAKSARHSVDLLRRLPELTRLVNVPVVIGASRKSFLSRTQAVRGKKVHFEDDGDAPDGRLGASVAAAIMAAKAGATVLRVHDVRETRQAIAMATVLDV